MLESSYKFRIGSLFYFLEDGMTDECQVMHLIFDFRMGYARPPRVGTQC